MINKKRILVVEDDPLLSQTIDLCLTKKGHDVKVLYSGAEAVKHIFEEQADSILLDVRLPDCDGWFVAKMLSNVDWAKEVPLIMMSVMEPDSSKVAEFRPYAYIQKPFDMGLLLQTIEGSLCA
jgi:DNA-binding response OmpR family regulator